MSQDSDFDMQAAWHRRFKADVESNLKAFALRLKEAMPELVTVKETRAFFSGSAKITGVTVELGESRYTLEIEGGRLKAKVAMVVRGTPPNTKNAAPGGCSAGLPREPKRAGE